MIKADISRVAEINVFARQNAFRGIVSDKSLFAVATVQERMEYFAKELLDDAMNTYVFDDGIIKGFLTIGPCRDEDELSSFELWGLYTEQFFQGQGIGMAMVGFCEAKATELGYNKICLWTLDGLGASIAFYEKFGYAHDGAKKYENEPRPTQIRYFKGI